MSSLRFNLDLNLIETALKAAGFSVEPALSMPALLRAGVQRDTTFVLPLDEMPTLPDEIGGFDVSQYSPERFGIIGAFRAAGSSAGTEATARLLAWRELVKESLVGLILGDFEAIWFEAGRLIEVNKDTQTVLYQLQFATAHNVVTDVRR